MNNLQFDRWYCRIANKYGQSNADKLDLFKELKEVERQWAEARDESEKRTLIGRG